MSDSDTGGAAPPDSGEHPGAQLPAPEAAPAPAGQREDLVTNAMAFLSHPKVRASAAASKREFLQRKGLSEAEIDEAFRRVPQEAAAAPAAAPPASAVQATLQHLQPGAPYATASPPPQQQQLQPYGQPPQPQPPQGVRWTQAVLGAGLLAATGYAAKQLVWPHVEGAYYLWRGRPRPPPRPRSGGGASEEATRAMADAIQAQTAELRASIVAIKALVGSLEAAQRERGEAGAAGAAADGGLTVAELRSELRSFAETLHELASPSKPDGGGGGSVRLEAELGEIKGLLAEILRSPSGSRTPGKEGALTGGDAATPLSVTSALARHGLEGRPPEAAASSGSGGAAAEQQHQQQNDERADGAAAAGYAGMPASAGTAAAPGAPAQPPHPASYLEVLEMLERGQTPPGIRTDINDKPPDPLAPPAEPKLKPRPKPWERSGTAASGSSSSLASLGLPPPPPAAPAGDSGSGAPAQASAPASPAPLRGAEAALAEYRLSPVQAPSPAEEAQVDGQAGGEGQAAAPATFHSPKRATSIFEAVAPPPESPHIIAGRLSPSGRAPPSGGAVSSSGGSAAFASLLAAAEQRSSMDGGLPLPTDGSGSGIGRPSSRNWRPPPIPAPTLSGASSSRGGAAAAAPEEAGSGASDAATPRENGGAAVHPSPSAASLGADFASA